MTEDNGLQVDIGAAHILEEPLVERRKHDAIDAIRSCLGPKGVYASGGLSVYSYEYWTRDMCLSYEALERLGFDGHVKQHVSGLISMSRDGQIPTLFFERPRRLSPSAKFTDQIDNELLLLDILKRIESSGNYDNIWRYVVSQIGVNGFVYGRDWRDGMRIYVNRATFHNQVLLCIVCPNEMNKKLKERVNSTFWMPDKGYYADCVNKEGEISEHLDVLGHALALLHDLVPESRIKSVINNLESALTDYGYVNILPRYPKSACGMWNLFPNNLYQNGGIWGLIQGHMILALLHLDLIDAAADQFWTMTRWKGFNEWYSPTDGKPKGSKNQLWSAALWLRCYDALKIKVRQKLRTEVFSEDWPS